MTIALRLLLFAILFSPHSIEARSLFWQDLEVKASLDKDGRLHVREQQVMVFLVIEMSVKGGAKNG